MILALVLILLLLVWFRAVIGMVCCAVMIVFWFGLMLLTPVGMALAIGLGLVLALR